MKLDSNAIGKVVSFDTYEGKKLKNLKLISLLDGATMLAIGQDPVAGHKQNLPYLPAPKPVAYTEYLYAKFADIEGKSSYYGVPWVKESSIVVNANPGRIIRMPTAMAEQIESVKEMMVKAGIEDFTIESM